MSGFLTVAQVAEDSGFSARTVLRWVERGDLVAVRFPGGRLRIRAADYAAMQQAGATCMLASARGAAPLDTARPVASEVESDAGGS